MVMTRFFPRSPNQKELKSAILPWNIHPSKVNYSVKLALTRSSKRAVLKN
jgi:hypothetical protein